MNVTDFSVANFSTKLWINDVFKLSQKKNQGNYTMSLVMKIQLYVEQVNNTLEETSQQVLSLLPKILRDTASLQQEAFLLKDQISNVKMNMAKIEHETGINIIEKLDLVKSQLYLTRQSLQEKDNWAVLVNDIEEIFDCENIEVISDKILNIQNSLKMLSSAADYESRKFHLESLKNRLEAIASPSIVQAFTSNNTAQSQLYVKIFMSMERNSQLVKYYKKCQKDLLLKKWRNLLETEQGESSLFWLDNYYNFILAHWHIQYRWLRQVFISESVLNILIDIYIEVFQSLDPSINECTDAALKQLPDKFAYLSDLKQITKQFEDGLSKVIEQQGDGQFCDFFRLQKTIYAHMVPYIHKYAEYEQVTLMKHLESLNCEKEDTSDMIQALGLSITSVFDSSREAKKRCQEFTENCGYCGLLVALRSYFLSYAKFYSQALRRLDQIKKGDEDWNVFQLCFSLLQNMGEVLLNLQELEKDLARSILQLSEGNEKMKYKNIFLNNEVQSEFEALLNCVINGTQLSLLDVVTTEFSKICSDLHYTTFELVYAPISHQLDMIQSSKLWEQFVSTPLYNSDLPDYGFSPQEYITQIGQYLMTLPQHLEPFLFHESPSLSCALKAADPNYTCDSGGQAHFFLCLIARAVCQGFCDRILEINELTQPASRQLAHDINYLSDILEELGLSLHENLQQLSVLLKMPVDQYQFQSVGSSARLVAAVRQMRNIKTHH